VTRPLHTGLWILAVLILGSCGGGGGGPSGTGPTVTVTAADTLYSFGTNSTDGMAPSGVLLQGSDGNFYGTTVDGGIGGGRSGDRVTGNGTVFKVTPTGEETVMHLFAGAPADGANPVALIQGSDGNFYGATSDGGRNNVGAVFKLTPDGAETILYSFVAGNGPENPVGLIQASDGNFYGTTFSGGGYGGGAVFKVTLEGVETIPYSFGGTQSDGLSPVGQLVEGSDGNFYGVTFGGGDPNCGAGSVKYTFQCGTVFKVTAMGVETVLHSFSGPDGANPGAGLIQGSNGNLYGTTTGGTLNLGTVFEITPEGFATTLYSFSAPTTSAGFIVGAGPEGGLIQGRDGNFYGTTSADGENAGGSMFQLTPGGIVTVLYSFPSAPNPNPIYSATPAFPDTNLVQGSDGNLYGAAANLGAHKYGYFFKLVLSGN
jgi:uncharacterized repeat protein (TIGR03803 family)